MQQPQSNRPIRIVHCIGTMRLGGAEKQLAELICRLPRERFEQSLVLIQGGGPLIDRVQAAGCEVVSLDYNQKFSKWNPRCYLAMTRALWRFVRHLRRRRPDILHAQLYWANILGVVAGRLARVPVVLTSRLQLSHYKTGRPLLQRIENLANRWTTAIFANSEAVRRDALAHERVDPAKIHVIYNGVDLDAFDRSGTAVSAVIDSSLSGTAVSAVIDLAELRRNLTLAPGDFVVVAVANLHPYKGHEDLIRAAATLATDHPHLRVLLPGRDQGARQSLEKLIAELGVAENVRLLGERKDIPALLALADVVVHPSHEEGFSNSVLEGMASGKPMIVTNVGGNPEAVRDGIDGLVIPPRDPEALRDALARLITDPDLRRQMGASSRHRIETDFSMPRLVDRFAQWYADLAAPHQLHRK